MTPQAAAISRTIADPDIRLESAEGDATKVHLVIDGTEVSWAYVIPFTIRIESALVRMDGIGGVGTAEEHRNRGYSRRVLQAAVEFMRTGDAALSTLYGIADFYPKFGYATLAPFHVIRLTAPDRIPDLPVGYTARPLTQSDIPELLRLYHQNTRRQVGPIERDDASRSVARLTEAADQPDECRVVLREPDAIVGYLWRGSKAWWTSTREGDSLVLAEIVAENPAAAEAALGAARRWAIDVDKPDIQFTAPPDDPIATAAMFLNARFEAHHERDGDFMGRCLGLPKLFSALSPELTRRLRAARTGARGLLQIVTDEGSATLAVTPDDVSLASNEPTRADFVVSMPQHELARLSFGGFAPHEILARLPEPPTEPAAELLSILFPRRHPYIYPMDWF
jgi:predicted N-acetyltransferase YhbS